MKFNCKNMTITAIYPKQNLQKKNTWQTVKFRVNFTTSNYKAFRRPQPVLDVFVSSFLILQAIAVFLEDFGAIPEMKVYRCRVELHL